MGYLGNNAYYRTPTSRLRWISSSIHIKSRQFWFLLISPPFAVNDYRSPCICILSYICLWSLVVPRSAPRLHTVAAPGGHAEEKAVAFCCFGACCKRSRQYRWFLRYGPTKRCAIVSVIRWYCNVRLLRSACDASVVFAGLKNGIMACLELLDDYFRTGETWYFSQNFRVATLNISWMETDHFSSGWCLPVWSDPSESV